MKLHRNLKIFIICAIMGMATITVIAFSTLTASYFEKGLDIGLRVSMLEIGHYANLQSDVPQTVLGFQVTNNWDSVLPGIHSEFEKPTKHLEFFKQVESDGWLAEPNRAMFLLRYDHGPNDVVYVSRIIDEHEAKKLSEQISVNPIPHVFQIFIFAAVGLGSFALCMYFVMQLVAKPIKRLAEWARTLTPCQFNQPLPDFHYNELNRLASIVKNSLSSVEESLKREHKFLAHASHELRTPIAVVRSNTELMIKLVEKPGSIDKQKQVLERILRAGVTMTDLCDTLLWLNRGTESELPIVNVNLGELIRQLSQELNYLIKDKEVKVEIEVSNVIVPLPSTLCRIVLSNLIRNAYQHTLRGKVTIHQTGSQVSIINRDDSCGDTQEQLGFGLGLELTNRIIRHYEWDCQIDEHPQGRDVFINFS